MLDLIQHCEREIKQLIEFCLLLEPRDGYLRALKLLQDNYGRPNVIVHSCCDQIAYGPPLETGDSKSLNNLAQFLEECSVTLNLVRIIRF